MQSTFSENALPDEISLYHAIDPQLKHSQFSDELKHLRSHHNSRMANFHNVSEFCSTERHKLSVCIHLLPTQRICCNVAFLTVQFGRLYVSADTKLDMVTTEILVKNWVLLFIMSTSTIMAASKWLFASNTIKLIWGMVYRIIHRYSFARDSQTSYLSQESNPK